MKNKIAYLFNFSFDFSLQLIILSFSLSQNIHNNFGLFLGAISSSSVSLTFWYFVANIAQRISFFFAQRLTLWLMIIFGHEHMFQICDLLCIVPKLDILEILDLLLWEDKLIFALFIGYSELLLKMFHLLDEQFFVFESFFQNKVFLLFSFEIELKQDLILSVGMFGQWSADIFRCILIVVSP